MSMETRSDLIADRNLDNAGQKSAGLSADFPAAVSDVTED